MANVWKAVPRVGLFLAGVLAGALTSSRRESGESAARFQDLQKSIDDLAARINVHESATTEHFHQVDTRLDEHAAKFADVPSTSQIVAAMEQLLSKTMANLDERLTAQAHSIEVLKTTVSQTDGLLERVLESLDSLQSAEPAAAVLQKPTV